MSNLTAYKITLSNGSSYTTSMAAAVTLKDASEYFLGQWFTQSDEVTKLQVVKVQPDLSLTGANADKLIDEETARRVAAVPACHGFNVMTAAIIEGEFVLVSEYDLSEEIAAALENA